MQACRRQYKNLKERTYQIRRKAKGDHVFLEIVDPSVTRNRFVALAICLVIIVSCCFVKGGMEAQAYELEKQEAYKIQLAHEQERIKAEEEAKAEQERAAAEKARQEEAERYLAEQKAKQASYSAPKVQQSTNCNLRTAGVVYFGGLRFTYYSSRVLYHYRTPEWHTNANGMYVDKDGYLVCARSDAPQGSIVETPWGTAKVYDCGCAAGTVDMYVNW
ncbi:MAG: hypothetical protein HUJ62_05575 [Streptococcus gallolyticus]|nr:hypothetical protein [Streptococcus gallolyticus]